MSLKVASTVKPLVIEKGAVLKRASDGQVAVVLEIFSKGLYLCSCEGLMLRLTNLMIKEQGWGFPEPVTAKKVRKKKVTV